MAQLKCHHPCKTSPDYPFSIHRPLVWIPPEGCWHGTFPDSVRMPHPSSQGPTTSWTHLMPLFSLTGLWRRWRSGSWKWQVCSCPRAFALVVPSTGDDLFPGGIPCSFLSLKTHLSGEVFLYNQPYPFLTHLFVFFIAFNTIQYYLLYKFPWLLSISLPRT